VDGVALLTVFVLAVFVGYEVISKVSSTLHTPLMSGSNAISGIILVGTVVVAAHTESDLIFALELVAVALATVNLVGGFLVTDRMLQMFRRNREQRQEPRP
jgi:H+-translocating NAD(P) transhydrogenase subunit alpha